MTGLALFFVAGLRARPDARPSPRSGRSSASAARSTPKSPAASPNRWAACASSRAITPKSARRASSRAACKRLLDNVLSIAHRHVAHEPLRHRADGHGRRGTVMYVGARQILRGARSRSAASSPSPRSWRSWSRRCFRSSASARRSPRRSPASTAPTKSCASGPRIEDPQRTVAIGAIQRRRRLSKTSSFAYEAGKPVLHDVSFHVRARHRHRAGRSVRLRQIHHHQPDRRVP